MLFGVSDLLHDGIEKEALQLFDLAFDDKIVVCNVEPKSQLESVEPGREQAEDLDLPPFAHGDGGNLYRKSHSNVLGVLVQNRPEQPILRIICGQLVSVSILLPEILGNHLGILDNGDSFALLVDVIDLRVQTTDLEACPLPVDQSGLQQGRT